VLDTPRLTVNSHLSPRKVSTRMSITQKHYQVGYALYIARQPYAACQSAGQRRGWLAANAAEGEYVTPGYAQKMGY
jgi:hypothetical protein